MATTGEWKGNILFQLKRRNHKQSEPFQAIIQTNNRLQQQSSHLHSQNVHLQVEIERLKEENLSGQIRGEPGSGGHNTHALEQKLYKLQEELTELHKKRGENAQQIIDLNALLQEKERELQNKDNQLSDMLANNLSLKQEQKNLQQSMTELEATNQMLTDEHQALQMVFTALEEKHRKLNDDYREILDRWLKYKAQEADDINEQNKQFFKHRQEKLQKELQEAANDKVQIDLPDAEGFTPGVCLSVTIPTRAHNVFDAHSGEVYSVQWNNTGSLFATGGADRKINLWRNIGGSCETKGVLLGSNAGITSVEFSQDDSQIVGASNDFACRVWAIGTQRLQLTLTGHSGKVLSAKFLGDSKVVSGSYDRTLKVWDLNSRSCSKTIFAGSSCNDLVTLHGTSIISGHFDKRVRFWDTRGADTSINEILLEGRLTSLCLAPDRTQLLCCLKEIGLKVIDLRMNQVSHTLTADGFKVGCDWSRAVFSPDAQYAAGGSSDGSVYVWNLNKSRVERVLKEHSHTVVACAWNPSGTSLVSCEKGKKVVLWSDY
ncbi:autophagy-related protein 16-1 [Aplysia californica]|uniref:Autophagy-related protein 16-1 n=1 Tax=Aplysia californica TaxID=6500 RepID=A0ABM0K955_APLCA|nr:autophagy-related protein 16-1 [Aplysia californica]